MECTEGHSLKGYPPLGYNGKKLSSKVPDAPAKHANAFIKVAPNPMPINDAKPTGRKSVQESDQDSLLSTMQALKSPLRSIASSQAHGNIQSVMKTGRSAISNLSVLEEERTEHLCTTSVGSFGKSQVKSKVAVTSDGQSKNRQIQPAWISAASSKHYIDPRSDAGTCLPKPLLKCDDNQSDTIQINSTDLSMRVNQEKGLPCYPTRSSECKSTTYKLSTKFRAHSSFIHTRTYINSNLTQARNASTKHFLPPLNEVKRLLLTDTSQSSQKPGSEEANLEVLVNVTNQQTTRQLSGRIEPLIDADPIIYNNMIKDQTSMRGSVKVTTSEHHFNWQQEYQSNTSVFPAVNSSSLVLNETSKAGASILGATAAESPLEFELKHGVALLMYSTRSTTWKSAQTSNTVENKMGSNVEVLKNENSYGEMMEAQALLANASNMTGSGSQRDETFHYTKSHHTNQKHGSKYNSVEVISGVQKTVDAQIMEPYVIAAKGNIMIDTSNKVNQNKTGNLANSSTENDVIATASVREEINCTYNFVHSNSMVPAHNRRNDADKENSMPPPNCAVQIQNPMQAANWPNDADLYRPNRQLQDPYAFLYTHIGQIIHINGKEYTFREKISKGVNSQVYAAMQKFSVHIRAVKCFDLAIDPISAQGLLTDMKILSKLQGNKYVIRVFDCERIYDRLYLVMEKGETNLVDLLAGNSLQLNIPKIVYFWAEMLKAVQHIHAQGVVHLNLKPANMLFVEGHLKLIDFGVASIRRNKEASSISYVSPEALKDAILARKYGPGMKLNIGYKSDVWSLGCILYFMVYNLSPFDIFVNRGSRLAAITNPNYQIEFPMRPDCPYGIIRIIKLCLKYDMENRPSVQDLIRMSYFCE